MLLYGRGLCSADAQQEGLRLQYGFSICTFSTCPSGASCHLQDALMNWKPWIAVGVKDLHMDERRPIERWPVQGCAPPLAKPLLEEAPRPHDHERTDRWTVCVCLFQSLELFELFWTLSLRPDHRLQRNAATFTGCLGWRMCRVSDKVMKDLKVSGSNIRTFQLFTGSRSFSFCLLSSN